MTTSIALAFGAYNGSASSIFEMLGSWACPTNGVAERLLVQDGYAYVACGDAGLQVLDVSDPTGPKTAATLSTDGYAATLDHAAGLVCLAVSRFDSDLCVQRLDLWTLDVSTPTNPVHASTYVIEPVDWSQQLGGICVTDGVAYLTWNR